MATYNFSEISDFEFEALCRDLLQEEFGLSFELFTPGRDRGIDIRCIAQTENEEHTTIAQCKRWAENSFTSLLRNLSREELPKIKKLTPQRYILMTSVKLTPDRKDKIVTALEPWIRTPKDVFGKDDISGLLAKHKEVERRHIKLWLTSSEVLDALLNSNIYNRSEDALYRAKQQLRLWVPNPSFSRAQEILNTSRVCIISGPPGIGKTMLANVLSASYTSRGYQLVEISDDIEEGNSAWRANVRQTFLYDDFLGHVTYGELQLGKNEQSRLTHFLERVRRSENKRFILTTREYILSEALNRYERLSDTDVAAYKNFITLEDYTHLIRGQILYNHLFFSGLPSELKTALLPNERYWDVIRHPNYNPRVIEHAVSLPGVVSLSPDGFVSNIFATLEDPTKVWDIIFKNLPDMARRILLAMASLPTEVLLEDVLRVVEKLSPNDFDAGRFANAIGMVEGTFIDIEEAIPGSSSRQRVVVIRDPSVRDYLWARLQAIDGEADALLQHAAFFEQCVILYEGSNHAISMRTMFPTVTTVQTRDRDVVDHEAVASRAVDLFDSNTSPVVQRLVGENSEYFQREPMSLERRASFLIDVFAAHQTAPIVAESAKSTLTATIEKWELGSGPPKDALELLNKAMRTEGLLPENVLERGGWALFSLITNRLQQKEDFAALVGLASLRPTLFVEPHRSLESWSSEFDGFLEDERAWLLEELDDPDWLEEEMRQFRQIASAIGMDISDLEADVENRKDELMIGWDLDPDDYDYIPELPSDPQDELDVAEIDALFQSLR